MRKTNKPYDKLYVIKKYVYARSASEALKIERNIRADDVWVDEKWKDNQSFPKNAMGFTMESY